MRLRPGIVRALRDIADGHLTSWEPEARADRDVLATPGWREELLEGGYVHFERRIDRWAPTDAGRDVYDRSRAGR